MKQYKLNHSRNASQVENGKLIYETESGVVGPQGPQGIAGSDGETPSMVVNDIENGKRITFETTEQTVSYDVFNGSKGEQGIPGTPGADSTVPGPAGKDGTNGTDGVTPTIEVEPIENGHRVIINGESFDVLNGDGRVGEQGPQGVPGETPLITTYDEAGGVRITFKTTAQEESVTILNGAKGDKGDVGSTGPASTIPGPQGIQGETGPQGVQGETGPQGPQGVQGPQGIQGEKGDPGLNGEDGINGTNGVNGSPGPIVDITIDELANGTRVTMNNSVETQSFDVFNGAASTVPGPQGEKGDKGDPAELTAAVWQDGNIGLSSNEVDYYMRISGVLNESIARTISLLIREYKTTLLNLDSGEELTTSFKRTAVKSLPLYGLTMESTGSLYITFQMEKALEQPFSSEGIPCLVTHSGGSSIGIIYYNTFSGPTINVSVTGLAPGTYSLQEVKTFGYYN